MTNEIEHTRLQNLIDAAVRRIRELSVNGRPPARSHYSHNRRDAPSVYLMRQHGVSYQKLCELAHPHGVPFAVEQEIIAAFERGDHLPNHKRDWPLSAIPTKKEVSECVQPDGTVLRITRYYASLR